MRRTLPLEDYLKEQMSLFLVVKAFLVWCRKRKCTRAYCEVGAGDEARQREDERHNWLRVEAHTFSAILARRS